jgi:hypothetical protein
VRSGVRERSWCWSHRIHHPSSLFGAAWRSTLFLGWIAWRMVMGESGAARTAGSGRIRYRHIDLQRTSYVSHHTAQHCASLGADGYWRKWNSEGRSRWR